MTQYGAKFNIEEIGVIENDHTIEQYLIVKPSNSEHINKQDVMEFFQNASNIILKDEYSEEYIVINRIIKGRHQILNNFQDNMMLSDCK